jgi:Tol biopolymer transport system component
MPLLPGARLGPYEIDVLLGAGGMGEVYRATDSHLKRSVAIKVLPASVAGDPDRLARFQREAEVLASLNHPHIAAIYGLEKTPGVTALVMELVDGEDLSQRIARGPIPLDEALPIAKQIAGALEVAHEQGIIHRDLKPANIKVRADGTVKVLDFGLAKAMEPGGAGRAGGAETEGLSMSPTLSIHATHAGIILGTAAYMAPEQARGKSVDRRADIWAFGVVVFEMLTGNQPFPGEDISHVLARVIEREPDWSALPATLAPSLGVYLRRCLVKDPRERLRDIGDMRLALAGAFETAPSNSANPESRPAYPVRMLPWAAAAVMTAVAAFAIWGWLKPEPAEPRPVIHFTTAAPRGVGTNPIAVSRDGSHIAFVDAALKAIYVRSIDDPVARPLPGTEDSLMPTFSPDGRWLAFVAGVSPPYQLKKIPVAGGAPQTLAGGIGGSTPMTWGDDGNLLLGGQEIVRVPEAGGMPVTIAKADAASGNLLLAAPQLLPGGKYILTSIVTPKGAAAIRIAAVDAATGSVKVLLEDVGEARFVPTGRTPGEGHLVYALNGSLFAAAFNADTFRIGPATPVLEGLRNLGALTHIGFSRSGTLAYAGRDNVDLGMTSTLVWVDRGGTEQPLPAPPRAYSTPRISPDGGRVAFNLTATRPILDVQLWVLDLARGTTSRLTFEKMNSSAVWTADGKRLIYRSSASVTNLRGALASVAADGSGQPVTLIAEDVAPTPTSVSPDGRFVIGIRSTSPDLTASSASRTNTWVLPLTGDATPQAFLDNRYRRGDFQFSPDGKWLAYQSSESGRSEIYVVPYPGPGGKSQVSEDGGTQPRWNRNGRELFFRAGARMMAVDVETGAAFRVAAARMLFEKASSDYDVAPDGKRFLMLKPAPLSAESTELHVILNWFDDLRRRVPLP